MKITRIREATAPIASEIRNAFISFSTMTISLVAVETDVVRDGKPVIGYGFTSNGRYAQGGILRERFIPRIMAADPKSLVDDKATTTWTRSRSGRPSWPTRSRAATATARTLPAALDMAVWDAVAKIAGKPLWRLLSERYNGGQARRDGARLSGRRLLLPRQGAGRPAGPRCAATRSRATG